MGIAECFTKLEDLDITDIKVPYRHENIYCIVSENDTLRSHNYAFVQEY